jgi:hypothetical protein
MITLVGVLQIWHSSQVPRPPISSQGTWVHMPGHSGSARPLHCSPSCALSQYSFLTSIFVAATISRTRRTVSVTLEQQRRRRSDSPPFVTCHSRSGWWCSLLSSRTLGCNPLCLFQREFIILVIRCFNHALLGNSPSNA